MTHNQKALALHILVDLIIVAIGILACHLMIVLAIGAPDKFMPYWCMIFAGIGCALIYDDIEEYNLRKKPQ